MPVVPGMYVPRSLLFTHLVYQYVFKEILSIKHNNHALGFTECNIWNF